MKTSIKPFPIGTLGRLIMAALIFSVLSGCQILEMPISGETPMPASGLVTEERLEVEESQRQAILPAFQDDLHDLNDLPLYEIEVDVDFAEARYTGEMTLTYTNVEQTPLDSLFFRLYPNGGKSYGNGSLQVTRITAKGRVQDVRYAMDDTVLQLILDESLSPGNGITIEARFQGRVPVDFDGLGYGIYNRSDRVMALANWYPILAVYDQEGWNIDPVSGIGDSVYSDSAYYQVDVRSPASMKVVTTGVETQRQKGVNNKQEMTFVSGPVRDFLLVLSPSLQEEQRDVGGLTLRSHYLPGDESRSESALEIAVTSIDLFNRKYGPIPYRELDMVGLPLRYAAGVEYPGVILIRRSMYEKSSPETPFVIVTTHEVAHQWWYSVVGNDVIDDPWLDEALATYSSALYYEEVGGTGGYQQIIDLYQRSYQSAKNRGLDDAVTEELSHFEATAAGRSAYSPIVYNKGALFYHNLREKVGSEGFFDALQEYYRHNRFGIGRTEDLLAAFEKSASQDLDAFYQEWLYGSE